MQLKINKTVKRNARGYISLVSAVRALFVGEYGEEAGVVEVVAPKRMRVGFFCYSYLRASSYHKRFFLYVRRDLDKRDAVTAMFHELVHARQRWLGELSCSYREGYVVWKGEEYKKVSPDEDWDGYRGLPWEDEAFTVADRLTKRYFGEV